MKNSTVQQVQGSAQQNVELQIIVSRKEAVAKGLKRYFTGKYCKHDHISERVSSTGKCCECRRLYLVEYNSLNKHKVKKQQSDYYKNNKYKVLCKVKEYRKLNKDKIAKSLKSYNDKNKKSIGVMHKKYAENNKDKILKRRTAYLIKNPLNPFMRNSINRMERATGNNRKIKAEIELGYSQEQFISHIESLFAIGMSWDNRVLWHIDHIKPLSLFLKQGVTDPKIINALSNLQPLWAKDNMSKGSKYYE